MMKRKGIRFGAASLLAALLVFSSVHPIFAFFLPHSSELTCYCCLNGDSDPSLRCACGCNNHNETDTFGLFSEAVPSRCDFNINLSTTLGPKDCSIPPQSVWLGVPTRPPDITS